MWRKFFEQHWSECSLREPVDVSALEKCQDELSVLIPKPLVDMFRETNGVLGPDGEYLILPVEEVVDTNVDMWLNHEYEGLYMPFESLFFISFDQSDDMYAFPILGDKTDAQRIFKWRRESDSRILYAFGLEQYLYKRWKCFLEADPYFWERDINCKDFDDYRMFLRWLSHPSDSRKECEVGADVQFAPEDEAPGSSMIG